MLKSSHLVLQNVTAFQDRSLQRYSSENEFTRRALLPSDCCPHKKGKFGHTQLPRGKTTQGCREKMAICKSRREAWNRSFPQGRNQRHWHLDFRCLASRTVRHTFLLFLKPPSFWYFVWEPLEINTKCIKNRIFFYCIFEAKEIRSYWFKEEGLAHLVETWLIIYSHVFLFWPPKWFTELA